MADRKQQILLGIDTGGTFTDAVLFSHEKGVITKAKSLTTKHDLAIGIAGAMDAVISRFDGDPGAIALVSLSTTLATNALVEGKGGSVGLVMIGFDEADVEKQGLREALGSDPVIFVPGGHDVRGNETKLELECLEPFLASHKDKVSGFAVAGYFAVRNPDHEIRVRDYLRENTGLPVTCSHELSSKLGGPKRALTTLLNARLIPDIQQLILACRSQMERRDITCPLTVVRGDGTLVDADFALARPIETILSGPAASLMGARRLLDRQDVIVSDIGGTTTDVAILENGWPRIDPNGATVGGMSTMVEAVAMHTYGLGGDSEVHLNDDSRTGVFLGPRRRVPVSLLAVEHPQLIRKHLDRVQELDVISQYGGMFGWKTVGDDDPLPELKATETKLLAKLQQEPQPLDLLLKGSAEAGTLKRLVSRGLAQVSGFTPSDAMHVLGLQNTWDKEAALTAATIFSRQKDRFGQPVAKNPKELCEQVKKQMTRQSADFVIQTCMAEDEIQVGPGAKALLQSALDGTPGFVRIGLSLDRPLVGLGASAKTFYPEIGKRLSTECLIPEYADVANAVGAVAAEVRVTLTAVASSSDGGQSISVSVGDQQNRYADEGKALEETRMYLDQNIKLLADEAGAMDVDVEISTEIDAPEIEGSRHFVEARIVAVATGLPRIKLQ